MRRTTWLHGFVDPHVTVLLRPAIWNMDLGGWDPVPGAADHDCVSTRLGEFKIGAEHGSYWIYLDGQLCWLIRVPDIAGTHEFLDLVIHDYRIVSGYTHTQGVAASTWTVVHNLGHRPASVTVWLTDNHMAQPDIEYIDDNNLLAHMNANYAGVLRCQ